MNTVMTLYFNPWAFAIIIILLAVIIYFIVIWTVKAHKRKVAAGREDLVGRTAEVRAALNPKGIVFVEDELWSATIEDGMAEVGEEVTITRVEGLKLYVARK